MISFSNDVCERFGETWGTEYCLQEKSQMAKNTTSVQFADNILSSDYADMLKHIKAIVKIKREVCVQKKGKGVHSSFADDMPLFMVEKQVDIF